VAARIATRPYGKKKRRAVLSLYFDENWRMSEIHREKDMPSYDTIKRWVAREKKERQEQRIPSSNSEPKRGRPRVFSAKEIITMKSEAQRLLAEGKPVTRKVLREAIGRDHGPRKVSLQRISDYRSFLRLSHKRPVAKPKKQVCLLLECSFYKFLFRLNVDIC